MQDGQLTGTSVFGAVAETYRRPPIPESAADWLTSFNPDRVVDVAAGTGAFTELLAARVREVVAVEPDSGMRAMAVQRCPEVPMLEGTAENLPFGDASVDGVYASSAWHWFDIEATVREVARVLRPGGTLGVLWGLRDSRVPWMVELDRIVLLRAIGGKGSPGDFWLPDGAPFTPPERMVLFWNWRVSVDDLVASLGTYSSVIRLPDGERERVLDTARQFLLTRPELAGKDLIDYPVRTVAWRAQRR